MREAGSGRARHRPGRLQFLRSVDIETLISFLCSADTTYRLFAAVTLGNIASDRSLQEC